MTLHSEKDLQSKKFQGKKKFIRQGYRFEKKF